MGRKEVENSHHKYKQKNEGFTNNVVSKKDGEELNGKYGMQYLNHSKLISPVDVIATPPTIGIMLLVVRS